MIFDELKRQADKNWEDIEKILASPYCWADVCRYDVDLCHLKKKGSNDVLWETTTENVLKILEDTCDVEGRGM